MFAGHVEVAFAIGRAQRRANVGVFVAAALAGLSLVIHVFTVIGMALAPTGRCVGAAGQRIEEGLAMFSHIHVGVSDFDRAHAFYAPLMGELGLRQRFFDPDRRWAAWQPSNGGRPLFIIGLPFDRQAHAAGNGQMTAFAAADRPTVDRAHRTALEHGGSDEGAPGLRPHYHANYYGAYFRDPDGNKLCVVCHEPVVVPPGA